MRILTRNEICERALRKIGATAIRSAGSRAEEVEEASYWLDMLMGHIAARKRTWWLVPNTAEFTLTAGVWNYSLDQILGPTQAAGGVQAIIDVWLANANGAGIDSFPDVPGWIPLQDDEGTHPTYEVNGLLRLGVLRRQEWEGIQSVDLPTQNPQTGSPRFCYIDRGEKPSISFSPCPDAGGPYTIRALFQTYSPDFVSAQGINPLAMARETWNLCIVTGLARQLANGPVRKAPADEIRDMKEEYLSLLLDLESYDDEEQAGPGRVAYNSGIG